MRTHSTLRTVKDIVSFTPLYIKIGLGVLIFYLFYLIEKAVNFISVI
ncbi:MAG: hypothetical protein NWE89_07430 [Candidatus Bathyarchaeota archaeon]|nr:hypothetical protein [Candidatus Bathyarchaeota archaeon]